MHDLEERLSPSHLRREGFRKAKIAGWEGIAKVLEYAQRNAVQLTVLGGAVSGALWLAMRDKTPRMIVKVRPNEPAGLTAAKALGATAFMTLLQKRAQRREKRGEKPALSGMALAATAAKAFLSGARSSQKTGTTRPGKKVAWQGLATSIGAALGSSWYRHKMHRA